MSTKSKREEHYIVFKVSDVEKYFTFSEKQQLERLVEVQRVGWEEACKPPLDCVVIESGRSKYEQTSQALETSVPESWLRAIDEALVAAHIGVANASDTYEQAKAKLDSLIGFHVDVATDPAVNGGWKLMPEVKP